MYVFIGNQYYPQRTAHALLEELQRQVRSIRNYIEIFTYVNANLSILIILITLFVNTLFIFILFIFSCLFFLTY